jgi:phage gp36-like protein
MIYSFITEKDLDVGMKKYFREQITDVNNVINVQEVSNKIHIQITSEAAAFSLIKSKLNARYDIVKLFPEVKNWTFEGEYLLDEYVWRSDNIYKAIQDGTGRDPDTETGYWKLLDPRDQLLVVYCAIITIWFMMRSINPRKISHELDNDYAGILEWLDDIKEGKESPDWPIKDGGTNDVIWGSNEKLDHYY